MLETHASEHRNVFGCTLSHCSKIILILSCATLITYCPVYLFRASSRGHIRDDVTIPFVLYGLFRI
jgi:hypothetical protein